VNNETISLGEVCGVDVVVYAGGLGPFGPTGGGGEPLSGLARKEFIGSARLFNEGT